MQWWDRRAELQEDGWWLWVGVHHIGWVAPVDVEVQAVARLMRAWAPREEEGR